MGGGGRGRIGERREAELDDGKVGKDGRKQNYGMTIEEEAYSCGVADCISFKPYC